MEDKRDGNGGGNHSPRSGLSKLCRALGGKMLSYGIMCEIAR